MIKEKTMFSQRSNIPIVFVRISYSSLRIIAAIIFGTPLVNSDTVAAALSLFNEANGFQWKPRPVRGVEQNNIRIQLFLYVSLIVTLVLLPGSSLGFFE